MEGKVLNRHTDVVQRRLQPHSFLLASASIDGYVCLWSKAAVPSFNWCQEGFSCLAWHPQGQQIAAGDTTVNY